MKRVITGSSDIGKFLADSPAAKGAGRRQAATGLQCHCRFPATRLTAKATTVRESERLSWGTKSWRRWERKPKAPPALALNISSGICSDMTNCPNRSKLSHTGGGTQSAPILKMVNIVALIPALLVIRWLLETKLSLNQNMKTKRKSIGDICVVAGVLFSMLLAFAALETSATAMDNQYWISTNTDSSNLGTLDDPFVCNSQPAFDSTMNSLPANSTIHLLP